MKYMSFIDDYLMFLNRKRNLLDLLVSDYNKYTKLSGSVEKDVQFLKNYKVFKGVLQENSIRFVYKAISQVINKILKESSKQVSDKSSSRKLKSSSDTGDLPFSNEENPPETRGRALSIPSESVGKGKSPLSSNYGLSSGPTIYGEKYGDKVVQPNKQLNSKQVDVLSGSSNVVSSQVDGVSSSVVLNPSSIDGRGGGHNPASKHSIQAFHSLSASLHSFYSRAQPPSRFNGLHKLLKLPADIQLFSRVLPALLICLLTICIRVPSLNQYIVHGSLTQDINNILWSNSNIILSLVTALGLTYALNYRNMPKPLEIFKLFTVVLITFISIHVLLEFLTLINEIISSISKKINLADISTDKIEHSVSPTENIEPTDKIDNEKREDSTTPWYKNKKLWFSVMFAGVVLALVYYLKGFAPVSPDDMEMLNDTVSRGVDNIFSEGESLNQTLSEGVNNIIIRTETLNSTSEGVLSDVIMAGEAARLYLEQMTGVRENINLLHGRVDNMDNNMSSILHGIMYLISMKWLFLRANRANQSNQTRIEGSEIVNEVLSLERPFDFSEVVRPTVLEEVELIAPASEFVKPPATVSTQTSDMDFSSFYDLISPYIPIYGAERILLRVRSTLSMIDDSLEEEITSDPSSSDYTTPHRLAEQEGTSQTSPVTQPSLGITSESVDCINVYENPTFQPSTSSSPDEINPPSTLSSPDEINPYRVHRHIFFRISQNFLYIMQFLDKLGF